MARELLTKSVFAKALNILGERDPDLGAVLSVLGPPPMWIRKPGFPTLVHIILEQQVSLASAKAAFDRLHQTLPSVTPEAFLSLDGDALRGIGFSRQKTRYCRVLAEAIINDAVDLGGLTEMDDDQVRIELMKLSGIGRWTVDIYLLMVLKRPDVLPLGDLALLSATQTVKRLETRPTPNEFKALGEQWKPWRAVAARILWHHYLSAGKDQRQE